MNNKISSKDLLAIGSRLRVIVDPVLSIVFSATSKRYKGMNPPNHEFLGSGFLVTDGVFPFLITARHVFENSPIRENFFHSIGPDKAFPLRSVYTMTVDTELDIAIMGCFDAPLRDAGIHPLSLEHLDGELNRAGDSYFYCNGFPGQLSVHFPQMKDLLVSSYPIIGKQVDLPTGFSPTKHFAFEYPRGINPQGMSGAPIWDMGISNLHSLEDWSITNAFIAGIAIQWIPKKSILIGTRVEQIRKFVKPALKHLIESNGWIDGNEAE